MFFLTFKSRRVYLWLASRLGQAFAWWARQYWGKQPVVAVHGTEHRNVLWVGNRCQDINDDKDDRQPHQSFTARAFT